MITITGNKYASMPTTETVIIQFPGKYKHSRLSFNESQDQDLYNKLIHLMEDIKIFREINLSLDLLAEKMMIHRNKLSQLINSYCKSNYNDFVNNYRIEEAKRLIVDSHKKRSFYKTWRISFDVGFNSIATFYRAFSKFVGCTPSEYRDLLRKLDSDYSTHSSVS